jgi:ankyrin repeat protein
MGFAAEVSHCLFLCGETYRKGDKGATNDMLARSLERQCGASAARKAEREDFAPLASGNTIIGATQLIRAAILNNLPRVLQLVQLGAPLELRNKHNGASALHWACEIGHEQIARALLEGKFEGRGADVDTRDNNRYTPLIDASRNGHERIVRLLLACGARPEVQSYDGFTAMYLAVSNDHAAVVALLLAAPGAAAALALRYRGRTPLGVAVAEGHAACEALLRARGAPL